MIAAGLRPELTMQHPMIELAVRGCVSLLMAAGMTGLGWFLVFRVGKKVDPKEKLQADPLTRALVVCGWIGLVGGISSIALFVILIVFVGLKSL
jgi:hypothetical protein